MRKRRKRKRKRILGRALVPKPGYRWTDKKKKANKEAARGRVNEDTI